METESVTITIFYCSKNGYDFSKSSNEINIVVNRREYNIFVP